MAVFSISKNLFRRFFYSFYGQTITVNISNSSSLRPHFCFPIRINLGEEKKWVTITFERQDGARIKRIGEVGTTIYELIGEKDPDFPLFGVCDGQCCCSTCHVIFTKEDFNTISKYKNENEKDENAVLDEIGKKFPACVADVRTDTSRLGCLVRLVPEMDGMIIKLPKTKSIMHE